MTDGEPETAVCASLQKKKNRLKSNVIFLFLLFFISLNLKLVQELCESRSGRPGLSVLTSLTVSVDVKQHCTVLRQWSQFVPNMSTDIRGHESLLHHHHGSKALVFLIVLYVSSYR